LIILIILGEEYKLWSSDWNFVSFILNYTPRRTIENIRSRCCYWSERHIASNCSKHGYSLQLENDLIRGCCIVNSTEDESPDSNLAEPSFPLNLQPDTFH
jgi:hypothetical protein